MSGQAATAHINIIPQRPSHYAANNRLCNYVIHNISRFFDSTSTYKYPKIRNVTPKTQLFFQKFYLSPPPIPHSHPPLTCPLRTKLSSHKSTILVSYGWIFFYVSTCHNSVMAMVYRTRLNCELVYSLQTYQQEICRR